MELIQRSTSEPTELIERNGKREICGYGAIYYDGSPGSEYPIGDGLTERFQKGCFDSAVARGANIEIRYNHDEDFILDQTSNSAVVRCDDKGIRWSIPYDSESPDHIKVSKGLKGGWIKGSSIGAFNPKYKFDREGGKDIAWVTGVEKIRDVGPVNTPAYKGATAMTRSEALDEQYNAWLETQKRIAKYLNK